MLLGHVRDYLPRLTLNLPGPGGEITVEFVLDTGFDGELTLPSSLLAQVSAAFSTERIIRLADGTLRRSLYYEVALDWSGERLAEVAVLEGNPLLGAVLLNGSLLQIEMTDGGEVSIEPL